MRRIEGRPRERGGGTATRSCARPLRATLVAIAPTRGVHKTLHYFMYVSRVLAAIFKY